MFSFSNGPGGVLILTPLDVSILESYTMSKMKEIFIAECYNGTCNSKRIWREHILNSKDKLQELCIKVEFCIIIFNDTGAVNRKINLHWRYVRYLVAHSL